MKLGLTVQDLMQMGDTNQVLYVDDCHKHWYTIAVFNETALHITKKVFADNAEGKFINEIWVCFDEELTEFSYPMFMVRVEENKNFYYYPIMGDDLKVWFRDLILPEISKINKLTEEERQDYYLKHSPSNNKESE